MLTRVNGKLRLKDMVMTIVTEDLFDECENEVEVRWLMEQLIGVIKKAALDKTDELDFSLGELIPSEVNKD